MSCWPREIPLRHRHVRKKVEAVWTYSKHTMESFSGRTKSESQGSVDVFRSSGCVTSRGIRKRGSGIDGTGHQREAHQAVKPSLGVARVESRSAGHADLFEWAGSTTGELFSRCVSYLFIGGWNCSRAILARARENQPLSPFLFCFSGFRSFPTVCFSTPVPRRSFAIVAGTGSETFANRLAGGSRSRSEGGSDAGA